MVVKWQIFLMLILYFLEKSSQFHTDAHTSPLYSIPGINVNSQDVCNRPTLKCKQSRYRSIDGTCNNLRYPYQGSTNSTYVRFVKSNYADGVSELPKLPNARYLRLEFFKDENIWDCQYTLITMQWGQLLSHDLSLTAGVPQNNYRPPVCCSLGNITPRGKNSSTCAPITIPSNDPIHKNGSCWDFVRTTNTKHLGCTGSNEPAEQVSTVTSHLDCSMIFGSTPAQAKPLRSYVGGQLKTVKRQGQYWPPQDPDAIKTCKQLPTQPCYLTGDIRANQNLDLAILQVAFVRDHNNKAKQLAELNPGWSDEKIFQETRRIVIAQYQHITYYEHLPVLLGYEHMVKRGLIYPNATGYINDYDPEVNAGVMNEFATAAFRHFHSLIVGTLQMASENRKYTSELQLSEWFFKPYIIEYKKYFNDHLRGMTYYPMSYDDQRYDTAITQYLFKEYFNKYGTDLISIDLQRNRDHGLPSYVAVRAACGLSVPKTFDDMIGYISIEHVEKLKVTYNSPEEVDSPVGGSLEINLPGSQVGETYHCVMSEQFWRTRVGDRFFYESSANGKDSLTLSQLQSIRKGASAARMLCDTSDVTHMQLNVFKQVSVSNPLVPCESIPSIDLSLWKEEKECTI